MIVNFDFEKICSNCRSFYIRFLKLNFVSSTNFRLTFIVVAFMYKNRMFNIITKSNKRSIKISVIRASIKVSILLYFVFIGRFIDDNSEERIIFFWRRQDCEKSSSIARVVSNRTLERRWGVGEWGGAGPWLRRWEGMVYSILMAFKRFNLSSIGQELKILECLGIYCWFVCGLGVWN